MIDKTVFIETVIEKTKKLPVGHYLDVRTYKRNRSVLIVKKGEYETLIIEDGFFKETFLIKMEKLKKILKMLLQKEFPRSHKIRVYAMGLYTESEHEPQKRKII